MFDEYVYKQHRPGSSPDSPWTPNRNRWAGWADKSITRRYKQNTPSERNTHGQEWNEILC